ncbi:Ger(x)C family spore germination protein [Bacillus sp. ISL-51]|uniref:Ger(x)C family spore germination protein n=1 Tax=Bacteria TaxID=2 RepID=UPI001BEB7E00|nr:MULTISPECIES: Ger(x)C family spore germination protein [Bacteria]MBT2572917.1 Ger(x)C family spore germination protein [Bacillus sp. ISL-51]MBT2635357.1 Ger(x)C family spore germination protein [Bacillus sp. ISL-26]MBT2713390.1 Ger(x)C family spore germination protein [Pseudomonas sp. ISL-88]
MPIKKAILLFVMCACLTLTGCWDQNLLKDISLVLSASLDVDHDGKNKIGITYRKVQSSQAEQETGGSFITTVLSSTGHTIREARFNLDKLVDQRIDTSKQRVLLIGEKMTEKPLFPYLDVFYRDAKSPLLAHPAVVKDGEALDMLKLIVRQKLIVSKYLTNLLASADAESNISLENLQSIRSSMLTADEDFALPYLAIHGQTVKVEGSALFRGQQKVTEVLGQDSTLLTLLNGHFSKTANINLKLWNKYKMDIENYISLTVTDATQKITFLDADPQHIKVKVFLKLNARVDEYPKDRLDSYTAIEQINKQASADLNERAATVIRNIQEHNTDILGIGRKYQSRYFEQGKRLKWRKVYPSIEIIPDIHVNISQIGIVD